MAYTASARIETKYDFGDTGRVRDADPEQAIAEVKRWLGEIRTALAADDVIVALSDRSSRYFRHDIYPAYKSHRTAGERPLVLSEVKTFLQDTKELHTYVRPGLEADDVLGILATHPKIVPGERVVVTSDKDLKQIPGLHYNPRKPDEGITEVSPKSGDYYFYRQALTGDATDGFPGCPKIGPKRADALLLPLIGHAEGMWEVIVATYAAKGLDEAHALTQARVARILRHTDYDYTNKRPILWTPSSGQS